MSTRPFFPTVRELARCYQAFEAYSATHIRSMGLTPAQFDVIATLGNTPGMPSRELGEKTLITKGTLTGVVDRLESKRLVRRVASQSDGRSQIVQLTKKGIALFEKVFPAHVEYMAQAFNGFTEADFVKSEATLKKLREAFTRSPQQQ